MSPTTPEFYLALSRLATTNDPPSTRDGALIREVVEGLDQRVDEIRAQLQALELDLQNVERDRKFFRPMLSPLRRMPLEVLGEIFIHLTEIDRRNKVLTAICQVCKTWRQAALLVARLWCTVSFDPSNPSATYEGVSTWLGRAGPLPRSVDLDPSKCGAPVNKQGCYVGSPCLGPGKCAMSTAAVAKILKETLLLQRVSIHPNTYQCIRNLVDALHTPGGQGLWTQVTAFEIRLEWQFQWPPYSLLFDHELIPPSATSLTLELPDYEDIHPNLVPRFEIDRRVLRRLKSLDIACENWPADPIFKALRHCTNLETLVLNLSDSALKWASNQQGGDLTHVTQRSVSLPNLKSLHLDQVQGDGIEPLQHLKAPALREAHICFGPRDISIDDFLVPMGSADGTTLAAFLRGDPKSPAPLETLRISNGLLHDNALFNTLKEMTSLKHLIVENVLFKLDVFAKLSSQNSLLQLQTLKLLRLHTDAENLLGLQDFVSNRGIQVETSRCDYSECSPEWATP